MAQETLGIDQMWKAEERIQVAIEHENWFAGIKTELGNLTAVDTPLRVLITYVGNRELAWRPYKLALSVKEHLDKTQKSGEFLLLVSDSAAREWSTFKFAPKLVAEMTVLPPPTPGHKAAATRKGK